MFSFTRLQPEHPQNRKYDGPRAKALSQEVSQSLLSFPPDFTLLVDVGWDPALSMDVNHLIQMTSKIDAILLTHATISHLGAYAYLCKISTDFASIPVYSTLPVINMGRMITLDSYRSKGLLGPIKTEKVTLEDVEAAFDKITPLKYSQTISLEPGTQRVDSQEGGARPNGVSNYNTIGSILITPYNAGHTLGGTIWKIAKDQDVILYAVDWNHSRDSHLNGAFLQPDAQLIDSLSKPSLMICGTKISEVSSTLKKRRETLLRNIRDTIDSGGTVLIPTSTGSRVLELVHILNGYWENQNISTPLIYFSHVGQRTMSYASSMLEWMSSQVITEWQVQNKSPFELRNLRVMSNLNDLMQMDGPKVVLASDEAMEVGFSRQLFTKICSHDASMVILTERCGSETLAGQLFDIWMKNRMEADDPSSSSKYLPVHVTTQIQLDFDKEVLLSGDELAEYQEEIREKKQKLEIQSAIELRNRNILEQEDNELSDDEDDDEEDEMVMSGQMDIGILLYGKDVYDYDVRTMPKGKPKILPFAVKRRRVDEYGEILRPDQFTKQAERSAAENSLIASGNIPKGEAKSAIKDEVAPAVQYNDETFRLDPFSGLSVPTKLVPHSESLKVLCNVDFIDFDGVADWRSLKMILELVMPRQLIFLPSSLDIKAPTLMEEDADVEPSNVDKVVAEFERNTDMKLDLVEKAPVNEAILTQIGSNTYSVIITPELEKLLKWQNVIGDYSVAHVTGKLEVTVTTHETELEKEEQKAIEAPEVKKEADKDVKMEDIETSTALTKPTDEAKIIPLSGVKRPASQTVVRLVPLTTPADFAAAPRFHPSVVGDIRLAELKKQLVAKGHKAEFKAEGILVCDDRVAVRKMAQGNLVIEGGSSPEFYKVRGVVRSLLAFV